MEAAAAAVGAGGAAVCFPRIVLVFPLICMYAAGAISHATIIPCVALLPNTADIEPNNPRIQAVSLAAGNCNC
jgi:hypothetical protein